jgi:adenine-specific DNA-methyltransferase
MKNRLEVARELLRDDGVNFVQCDHHEIGYLNVLLDEIFEKENKIQQIAVKVASASGFKAVNPGPIDVLENILFYAKNKKNIVFEKSYVVADYHRNYNQYLDNKSKNVDEWKLIPLKEKVLQEHSISEKELRVKFGDTYTQIIERMIKEFAFVNAKNVVSIRDLHKPTLQVKELQEKSRKIRNKFFVYKKQDGDSTLIINGGAIAFYSSKIREIDGALQVTELLTNFWDHVSWAGIANEGGVTLKNGKKPEKLLKQLIEIACDKNDIILDFFVGSGTTAAVAHKMGRQYIGIEQLDYGDNDSIGRLKNVIAGDQTGISKSVNWQGGGSFIYCELMQWNEKIMQEIQKAKTAQDLLKIYENIKKQEFMRYEIKNFDIAEFEKLSIKHQKHILCDCIDKNHLYVNLSEIDDKKYEVSKEDKELNKKFFK